MSEAAILDEIVAPHVSAAQMIDKYIRLRAKVQQIADEAKKTLEPYRELMGRLEGYLLAELDRNNCSSMRSEHGTVYKATQTSVSVKHWSETLKYIQENEAWDLLEARVSKTAAVSIVQETGHPIPGVDITQATALHVRKA